MPLLRTLVLCAQLILLTVALPPVDPRNSHIDCTFRESSPYNINISNWLADGFKVLTCNEEVCSSGTHKYIRCASHLSPNTTTTVSINQGVRYMVFYDLKVKLAAPCGLSSSFIVLPCRPGMTSSVGLPQGASSRLTSTCRTKRATAGLVRPSPSALVLKPNVPCNHCGSPSYRRTVKSTVRSPYSGPYNCCT